MASQRVPIAPTGQILSKSQQRDSSLNYDDFQERLQRYTENEETILDAIESNNTQDVFNELVNNFSGKDNYISNRIEEVDRKIRKLEKEISSSSAGPSRTYETEIKKIEMDKLKTFRWLMLQELKNEEFRKEEALKKFMAVCVNNTLEPETPDI